MKMFLLIPGIMMIWVLAFGDKPLGGREFPLPQRSVRLAVGIVALALILTGAYWK
jgi:hypothetical protein